MYVVGVDGGGTHTRARIANERGETLATGNAGWCNVSTYGIAGAQQEIERAIQNAFEKLGHNALMPDPIAALCLGISGVDRSEEREPFRVWARQRFAPRVAVVNDGELVLAAATPDNWGVAVIAGTGSFVYGKTRQGERARAGGWGYLIGDEGSGFELGREALRAATHAADGTGEATRLLDDILAHWQLHAATELVARIYRAHDTATPLRPAEMAQLAPIVLNAADAGDMVATRILQHSAQALAQTALAVTRKLEFASRMIPLALGGGLLLGAPEYRELFLQECERRSSEAYHFSPIGLAAEPVHGAVKIALGLL